MLNETVPVFQEKRDATCHPVTSGTLQHPTPLDEGKLLAVIFGDVQRKCAEEEAASDWKRRQ